MQFVLIPEWYDVIYEHKYIQVDAHNGSSQGLRNRCHNTCKGCMQNFGIHQARTSLNMYARTFQGIKRVLDISIKRVSL
jgi:hypothetical protein